MFLSSAALEDVNCKVCLLPRQEVPALPFVTSFWERNLPSVGGFLKLVGVSTVLSAAAAAGLVAYKKGLLPRS